MNVTVLYSVPTARGEKSGYVVTDSDTEESAHKIESALKDKVTVSLFPVRDTTIPSVARIRADLIINLIEWDGVDLPLSLQVVDELEKTGIPYTGATKTNYHVTTDKILMKQAFDVTNIPTALWQQFITGNESIQKRFQYPVIIKLSTTHCSVGLNAQAVVENEQALRKQVIEKIRMFGQPVIAEEFIDGREFQVTMLERVNGLSVLPPAEITFDPGIHKFLTFDSRWSVGHPDYKTSHIRLASLDDQLFQIIQNESIHAFTALKFRDYARFDIRVRGTEEVLFMETNSNPGLDDDDEYGMTIAYKAIGLTFSDFLMEIIQSAMRRKHA